jgi:hypothetical protein
MTAQGFAPISGNLENRVIRHKDNAQEVSAPLSWKLKNNLTRRYIGSYLGVKLAHAMTRVFPVTAITSELKLKAYKKDEGVWVDYGVVGRRVVTNAGASYIVDAFQDSVELEEMKFHGTGSNNASAAEDVTDTALAYEFDEQLISASTRATGTTAEGGTGNEYQTVATNTYGSSAIECREHGIFSGNHTSGAGVLLDRTVFAVISLGASDSLQSTYTLTIVPGS